MTSTSAADSLTMPVAAAARPLPRAGTVLVVTARPGQESADLGGPLYAFRRSGASLALLCLTRGEASPLNSTWCRRLEAVRPWELQLAANVLGISEVTVASCPDGGLHSHPAADLTQRRPARDPPVLRGPAAGHRPGGGRPRRHSRRPGRVRCRQPGGRPGRGVRRAARRWHLDDRPGRRRRHRPRHPEIRRSRAPEPVPGTARADTPPGPARWPGSTALAGTSVPRARAQQDDPGCAGVCLTGREPAAPRRRPGSLTRFAAGPVRARTSGRHDGRLAGAASGTVPSR